MEMPGFMEMMREGGAGMWPAFVLGLVGLFVSGRFAAKPDPRGFAIAVGLWVTLGATVVLATWTDLAATFQWVQDPARTTDAQFARMVAEGLKESARPGIIGGIFLTLMPLLVTVGIYRQPNT
ncbi:MAG TPA: hypothetical protein VH142_00750 [Polyangiaceae bacterium]|jgi:hypothetical protein|nr:hypothetical protein [Polyangiaceae bacterium]